MTSRSPSPSNSSKPSFVWRTSLSQPTLTATSIHPPFARTPAAAAAAARTPFLQHPSSPTRKQRTPLTFLKQHHTQTQITHTHNRYTHTHTSHITSHLPHHFHPPTRIIHSNALPHFSVYIAAVPFCVSVCVFFQTNQYSISYIAALKNLPHLQQAKQIAALSARSIAEVGEEGEGGVCQSKTAISQRRPLQYTDNDTIRFNGQLKLGIIWSPPGYLD